MEGFEEKLRDYARHVGVAYGRVASHCQILHPFAPLRLWCSFLPDEQRENCTLKGMPLGV